MQIHLQFEEIPMAHRLTSAAALTAIALSALAFAGPAFAQTSGGMSSPSSQINQMSQPNAMSSDHMSSGAMGPDNMSGDTIKKPKKSAHTAKPATAGGMSSGSAMGTPGGSMSAPSQTDTGSMSTPH
jgi:pentapeptide MXKDX repeat protein